MRPKKLNESTRRIAAKRYALYRRHHPKKICADSGISNTTLLKYAREFPAGVEWKR